MSRLRRAITKRLYALAHKVVAKLSPTNASGNNTSKR
jgi:hypothetical protein